MITEFSREAPRNVGEGERPLDEQRLGSLAVRSTPSMYSGFDCVSCSSLNRSSCRTPDLTHEPKKVSCKGWMREQRADKWHN